MGNRLLLFICLFATLFQCLFALKIGKSVPPNSFDDGDGKLVFLQTIWRHGARAPTYTFPTDSNKWDKGWGELTLPGMEQHVRLGKRLRARYTNAKKLTNTNYLASEVYVRSTDVNRTLLSATSNLIGFFDGKAGTDYPNITDWPKNYVPIPIHTPTEYDIDHVGNPLRSCKRSNAIMNLIKETPEVQTVQTKSKTLLDKLSEITKWKVDLWNIWAVYDAWFIDWDTDNARPLPAGFTKEIFNQTRDLNGIIDNYDYGIGLKPYKGFDIQVELTKIRGGPLLASLIGHIQDKIYCRDVYPKTKERKMKKLCDWIGGLNYYAYSAHDITIAALFATFDFNETNFDEPGFPHYSACVSIELWQDPKNQYYIKVFYWVPATDRKTHAGEDFVDLTKLISGCTDKCTVDDFIKRSEKYKLTEPVEKLCEDDKILASNDNTGSTASYKNDALAQKIGFTSLLFSYIAYLLSWAFN